MRYGRLFMACALGVGLLAACGSGTQQVTGKASGQKLMQPATAEVICTGNGEIRVIYAAPNYDKLAEAGGQTNPTFRWQLSDLGGHGACYLLGIPDKESLPLFGAEKDAKHVLRSVDTFQLLNGQCVCRPITTQVKEGVFRPIPKERRTQPISPNPPGQ